VRAPYDGSQLCAQTDPEVFFPSNNFSKKRDVAVAVAVCNDCPLINPCKEYARTQKGLYGVWGGELYDGAGYVSLMNMTRKQLDKVA